MQRLSRLYVSQFGSPTAWYDHLLFDLDDPETNEPTDVVFNLENAGGKTSLLADIFSCFDPKQERWLQHLQKRSHRFAEYFARDGRPSFLVMEWRMPPRVATVTDYRLIVGQAVSVRESTERGADVDRWFFAFMVTEDLTLEALPLPGLSTSRVRTMHDFVQWMHQAAKRSNGDFFHTKTQEDWVKHLGNARLLDIELLRMQVDFNSNEGGMEEGFLTFNSELDLLRRFLTLTLDGGKCATVRDAVAQTADKLRSKPKFERRLAQLTGLQSVMLPFAEAASRYAQGREAQRVRLRTLAGLCQALTQRRKFNLDSEEQSRAHADTQDSVAETSTRTSLLLREENQLLEGILLERRVAAAKQKKNLAADSLTGARHRKHCLEGARAWVHVEATRTRRDELDALLESEREGLQPVRQHAEIQGALLRSALQQAEQETQTRKADEARKELTAKDQIEGLLRERTRSEVRLQDLSGEQGQLNLFMRSYAQRREQLIRDAVLSLDDAHAQSAIERLSLQLEQRQLELESLTEDEQRLRDSEHTERGLASAAALEAGEAKAAQEPHRIFLAKGEALREELRESSLLRTAADTVNPDPDAPPLMEALDRLINDAHREIADRNVRLAQLDLDRTSILETGLAGRNSNVDAVVRALQAAGVRSARAANTYLAEVRPDAAEARSLVTSDPARFLGVTVAQGEWTNVTDLVSTLRLRLTAPVKISVSSMEPGAAVSGELVLPAQDDSAYNKAAALALRSDLDARISDAQEERRAYEQRRDQGGTIRERLSGYLRDYGVTRLHQARATIEELATKEQAATHRRDLHEENADKFQQQSSQIRARLRDLPGQITRCEDNIRRLREFQRELEADLDNKSARLRQIQALFTEQRARIEELDQTRQTLEKTKESAMEGRMRLGQEVEALRWEARQITHCDAQYPAEEQLLARPRGIETLRITYSDAVTTLQTQERERLGLLADRLEVARTDHTAAVDKFDTGFPDLSIDVLESLKRLDFELELRTQEAVISDADEADRTAQDELTEAQTQHRLFWVKKTRPAPRIELQELTDDAARERISANEAEIGRLDQRAARAQAEAERANEQANSARNAADKLQTLHTALTAAVSLDGIEPISVILPEDFETYTARGIREFQEEQQELGTLQQSAARSFRALTQWAGSPDLAEVEPELSHELARSEFEIACTDRERIVSLIADRIRATQDTLDGMQPDFENCVGEIYNLAHEAIRLLGRACAITMPVTAPYVGRKPILRMKAAFSSIAVEARKVSIRHHLNGLIDAGMVPDKGADLIANAVVAINARPDLGLELLKMEQNEAYQYQLARDLKGSKGQGSVIAMFLYLLISQLRADMQARAKRAGGGPLILDNPFAKVQTRALVDAQRLLAKEIGVQLIFFTANADYNMLSGFRRVIRLRKAGAHSKSGRSHIEMISATFADPPLGDEAALS